MLNNFSIFVIVLVFYMVVDFDKLSGVVLSPGAGALGKTLELYNGLASYQGGGGDRNTQRCFVLWKLEILGLLGH